MWSSEMRQGALPRCVNQYRELGHRIVEIPDHGKASRACLSMRFRAGRGPLSKSRTDVTALCVLCHPTGTRAGALQADSGALQRAQLLAARGYREVVLVGINLTAYGKDTGADLCDAVETACAVEGIDRVRLGSLEPDCLTPAVIARLASPGCSRLCPQFHLSLQSGCDATLSRMRRRYTTDEYRQVCERLREAFPGCALTTDVMVGFPGETGEEFERSRRFVEEIGFARVHVFAYSRRAGTPAATGRPARYPGGKGPPRRAHGRHRGCRPGRLCRRSYRAYRRGAGGNPGGIRRRIGIHPGLSSRPRPRGGGRPARPRLDRAGAADRRRRGYLYRYARPVTAARACMQNRIP